jgi:hypothetical protein
MKQLWLSLGLVATLATWIGSAPSVRAQTRGAIAGAVRGPNGPIAGLTVNVVNDAGSVVGTAITMPAGAYTVSNLAVGTYTIQVVEARRVVATSVATVTPTTLTAAVDVTLTASELADAAVAAGGGMRTRTKVVLATAAAAAAGVLVFVATREDSSPTR